MAYLTSDQLGAVQRILDALGVTHQMVSEITIRIVCNDVPEVEVRCVRLLHEEEVDAIADAMPQLSPAVTVTEDPV